jgi:MFS family permease
LIGDVYPLAQIILTTTAVCFGFGFSNPALSAAASNAAGKTTMGGALGTVQGFASLGQVAGLVLAGPLYELGGSHYPFGFGACITFFFADCCDRAETTPNHQDRLVKAW